MSLVLDAPLARLSRRHRAIGPGNRKLLLNQHFIHVWSCERWQRETPRQGLPNHESFCVWKAPSLPSNVFKYLTLQTTFFDKIYKIIFSLALHDIAKASFSILHLDCPLYETKPSFTQSTSGNPCFFKQSNPSLSEYEQKHAAIFLELLIEERSSSFFSDREAKVKTGIMFFCLDIFKFIIIMFSQQDPKCSLNVDAVYKDTNTCNIST